MDCKDMDNLITAFLDGELTDEEQELIKAHLADCRHCQAAMEATASLQDDLRKAFRLEASGYSPSSRVWHRIRQCITAGQEPATPITTRIRNILPSVRRPGWKTGLIGALVVALVAALATTIPPLLKQDDSVLAEAITASEDIQSYRVASYKTTTRIDQPDIEPATSERVWEFSLPDCAHAVFNHSYYSTSNGVTSLTEEETFEFYIIGESLYFLSGSDINDINALLENSNVLSCSGGIPTMEHGLGFLQFLFELEQLPDEVIDGVECLHYQGIPKLGNIPCEIWIGKDDYFMRQITQKSESEMFTSTYTTRYYDFNEDIIIEAPVDSSGDLLPGWEVESIESAMPLIPVYEAIEAITGNEDWTDPNVLMDTLVMMGSVTEPFTYFNALPKEAQEALFDFVKSIADGSGGEIKTTITSSDGTKTVIIESPDGTTTVIEDYQGVGDIVP